MVLLGSPDTGWNGSNVVAKNRDLQPIDPRGIWARLRGHVAIVGVP